MSVFALIRSLLLIMAFFTFGIAPSAAGGSLKGTGPSGGDRGYRQPGGNCCGGWCIGCRFYERWDPYYGGYTPPYLHRPWSWYDYGYNYDRPFRYSRRPRYLYDYGGI